MGSAWKHTLSMLCASCASRASRALPTRRKSSVIFTGGWALWGWMLGRARASHSGQMHPTVPGSTSITTRLAIIVITFTPNCTPGLHHLLTESPATRLNQPSPRNARSIGPPAPAHRDPSGYFSGAAPRKSRPRKFLFLLSSSSLPTAIAIITTTPTCRPRRTAPRPRMAQ